MTKFLHVPGRALRAALGTILGASLLALPLSCEMPGFGDPVSYSLGNGNNDDDDDGGYDYDSLFGSGGDPGVLVVRGTEPGVTYDWAVARAAAPADWAAWQTAVSSKNTFLEGQVIAPGAEFEDELLSRGMPFIGTGNFLVTLTEWETLDASADLTVKEVWYWENVRFTDGNATVEISGAEGRNRDLLGGAVSFRQALQAINEGSSPASTVFNLTPEPETIGTTFDTGILTINKSGFSFTLEGHGKRVTMGRSGTLLTLTAGALTLRDITLHGSSSSTMPLVTINGGTLYLSRGSVIMGCAGSNSNFAVTINTGSLNCSGGEISFNAGYGVRLMGGTFTLSSGAVRNNANAGVYQTTGNFYMDGGEIRNNAGSGVYMAGGAFTMSGGVISGNKTSSNGGGVAAGSGFTMSGGEIRNNTAAKGGGVYTSASVLQLGLQASITGNHATDSANPYGGVFFASPSGSKPQHLDAVVTGNTPQDHNWP
ncbi:MAG: hypothetical protein LBQ44_05030 [Treponema sp.]|jgi:hypothetical protein|nr:hypothetical protein [Treponema sp.]